MTGFPSAHRTAGAFVFALVAASIVCARIHGEDLARDAWVAPARAARKKNPIPPGADSVAAGRAVYGDQCVSCHGALGRGDGSSALDLNPRPTDFSDPEISTETDGALFWKITNGHEPMPEFGSEISDPERWNVINFIRTLTPAATTQTTTRQSPLRGAAPRNTP